MKENLRTTHYSDGTSILLGNNTNSETIAYLYEPGGMNATVSTYGYLYNWPAVMGNNLSSISNPSGVQGICPVGWHVPSDAEWTQLTDYVSSQSEYRCYGSSSDIAKALASTTGWNSSSRTCSVGNNSSSNNATGFTAVSAGTYSNRYFNGFWDNAEIWSASEYSDVYVYCRGLSNDLGTVNRHYNYKGTGLSVRCLRD